MHALVIKENMVKANITAHMVVKNEDCWIWFSINSVLPYVDQLLISDTGSTDNTLKIIRSIKSSKIKLTTTTINSPKELTSIRQAQIDETKTPWIWIVDGDEIYFQDTAQEITQVVQSNKYEGILVRRRDLLGDIYHTQREGVGEYSLFGHQGHLLVRLINQEKIKGLEYQGDYPLEGLFDHAGTSILEHSPQEWYLTKNYLYHTMYLKRSSEGANLRRVLHRNKYKVERGIRLTGNYPEVFDLPRPNIVPDPLAHRSRSYELASSILTPIKNIKRRLFR